MNKRERLAGDKPTRQEGSQVAGGSGVEQRAARWPDTMQRARGRQAAITRNIHTWSNYKTWADKVRSTWEAEPKK
jgi:hypothetical protein